MTKLIVIIYFSCASMFQLQQSSDCNNDYLEIREGNSTGALVGRFCGVSLPSNYTSLIGHILWVKFRSDSSLSGAGFRATFSHCECVLGFCGRVHACVLLRAVVSYCSTHSLADTMHLFRCFLRSVNSMPSITSLSMLYLLLLMHKCFQ